MSGSLGVVARSISGGFPSAWSGGLGRGVSGWSQLDKLRLSTHGGNSPGFVAIRTVGLVDMVRQVIVFDAADLDAESGFWAGMLGGRVFRGDNWHSVIDAAGEWRIGVQLAPNHVPPDWPHGLPQQVHLDLHVVDPRAAHEEAMALGARLLQAAPDFDAVEGHQVYADPAGHPFCIGWGHPSRERLAAFVAKWTQT